MWNGKKVGLGNSDRVRNYMIEMFKDIYFEEMVAKLAILSQINLIKEKCCLDNESDIKKLYCDLRKRMLGWLEESNTKPEVDDEQYYLKVKD